MRTSNCRGLLAALLRLHFSLIPERTPKEGFPFSDFCRARDSQRSHKFLSILISSSSFINSNDNVIKDSCYYQTFKAAATLTNERIKMRRIIGTRANGRMLTSSGLTFPAWSVTTLVIDRKSRMSFYFFMRSCAMIVLPNNAEYACPDCESIANCRARDEMH